MSSPGCPDSSTVANDAAARLNTDLNQRRALHSTNSSVAMHNGVACRTKRNQILLRIVAGLTAELFVMDFKIRHCAAQLASPSVATQHLIS